MPSVENKTKKPLKVPLPGGKILRLGPLATGQITAKAVDHPPLQKLVEAGEIEVLGGRDPGPSGRSGGSRGRTAGPQSNQSGGGVRHTGDR